MAKFSINNFRDVCCLTSFSISVAALASLTPQPSLASQSSGAAEVEDEWVDFFGGGLSGTNIPDAGDTYAIKRNVLGTGRGSTCLQGRTNTRSSSNSHCGASAVWVKGDHSKNSNVRYRTSLTRYGIHCSSWTYSKNQFLAYSAKGEVISQWEKAGQVRAIVPESFEESIARAYCSLQKSIYQPVQIR
jgi:hypothetical protein